MLLDADIFNTFARVSSISFLALGNALVKLYPEGWHPLLDSIMTSVQSSGHQRDRDGDMDVCNQSKEARYILFACRPLSSFPPDM